VGTKFDVITKRMATSDPVLGRVDGSITLSEQCAACARHWSNREDQGGSDQDVIIECTGVGQVIADAIQGVSAGGVVCLTGIGTGGRTTGLSTADVGASVVLKNNVVVGSVNANKRHWYKAAESLARADRSWLARLISRKERPENFRQALHREANDIKVVIQFAEA